MNEKKYSLETPVISSIKKWCNIDDIRNIPKDIEKNTGYARWLIDHAKKEILIRAGELNSKYYEYLVSSLKDASEKGVSIKILFGPYLDVMSMRLMKFISKCPSNVMVKWDCKREMPHFFVVDSEYLRLESDHKPLSSINERYGIIGRTELAESYKRYFYELWEKTERTTIFDLTGRLKKLKEIKEYDVNKETFRFIKHDETTGEYCFATDQDISKLENYLKDS